MNIEPMEALELRQQIDDVEDRLEKIEQDEFIRANRAERGRLLYFYQLVLAFWIAVLVGGVLGVVWVGTWLWGLM